MSRFTPDHRTFFDTVYNTDVPGWEVGKAQPALMELVEEFPPDDPILDVGCGTGDLALELARRGSRVVGIDLAEAAISLANEKLVNAAPEIAERLDFHVGDALRPSLLEERFGAVVDSGFFHLFDPEQRDAFVDDLASALRPGGRFYLLAFGIEFPMPNTPLKVTEEELRTRFTAAKGWRILTIRPAEFESRIAPVPAVLACMERS